jgi:hypothetical protein
MADLHIMPPQSDPITFTSGSLAAANSNVAQVRNQTLNDQNDPTLDARSRPRWYSGDSGFEGSTHYLGNQGIAAKELPNSSTRARSQDLQKSNSEGGYQPSPSFSNTNVHSSRKSIVENFPEELTPRFQSSSLNRSRRSASTVRNCSRGAQYVSSSEDDLGQVVVPESPGFSFSRLPNIFEMIKGSTLGVESSKLLKLGSKKFRAASVSGNGTCASEKCDPLTPLVNSASPALSLDQLDTSTESGPINDPSNSPTKPKTSLRSSISQYRRKRWNRLSLSPNLSLVDVGHDHDSVREKTYTVGLQHVLQSLRDVYDLLPSNSEAELVKMLYSSKSTRSSCEFEKEADENTPEDNERNAEKRLRCIEEVIETEKTYIDELGVLVGLYLEPLLANGLVSASESNSMFSNVESILRFHTTALLPSLLEDQQRVGSVFAAHANGFRMYIKFINSWDLAVDTFNSCLAKNKKFRQNIEKIVADPTHRQLNLQAYLLLPVQRILRYRLLLTNVLKVTPRNHPDYDDLVLALREIEARAQEINDAKRTQDQLRVIQAIEQRIKGGFQNLLAAPNRRFIREGPLELVSFSRFDLEPKSSSCSSSLSSPQFCGAGFTEEHTLCHMKQRCPNKEYYFFLFNDLLIQVWLFGFVLIARLDLFSMLMDHSCS